MLQRETFHANEVIFRELDSDRKLYFIIDGKVNLKHIRTKTVIKELGADESFGEIGFFSGQMRCCTAKSV